MNTSRQNDQLEPVAMPPRPLICTWDYRGVIIHEAGDGFAFAIHGNRFGADTLEEARQIIAEVLDGVAA